jgi:hypothetical protein
MNCSPAECQFDKALINELTERVAKLEKVVMQLMGQEMGKEVLQLINTWPLEASGRQVERSEDEKEVEHGTGE